MNTAFVLAAIKLATLSPQDNVLTLNEAIDRAVQNGYSIRIATLGNEKARAQVRQAVAQVGFQLNASGSYTRFASPTAGPTEFGGGRFSSQSLQAVLSFPVDLSGSNNLLVKGARANLDATAQTVVAEVNAIKSMVRNSYISIINANWSLEVQQSALKSAEDRLRNGQLKLSQGVSSEFDVLRLKTDVVRYQTAIIEAKNRIRQAKSSLNNLILEPLDRDFEVEMPSVTVGHREDEKDLTEFALKTRADLKSIGYRVQIAEITRQVERKSDDLSVSASLVHQRVIDPTPFQRDQSTQLQVSLSIPLWDGGMRKAKVAAVEKDREIVAAQKAQLEDAIKLQVKSALLNLNTYSEQMEAAALNVQVAEEAYRLAKVRFDNDLGVIVDLTTALEQVTLARAGLATARTSYLLALAELQRAIGDDSFAFRSPVN